MSDAKRIVYLDDGGSPGGEDMEFRLTYEGPLLVRQNDPRAHQSIPPTKLDNQHAIRAHFHKQLRRLWETMPSLRDAEQGNDKPLNVLDGGGASKPPKLADHLANKHSHYGHRFVPLITAELDLRCDIDVLMLRGDLPNRSGWAGDIDNRMKTLLDALRIPEAAENYSTRQLGSDMNPMYCLMEDDKLINKLTVETDQLLDMDGNDQSKVALVITMRIRPYNVRWDNLSFA